MTLGEKLSKLRKENNYTQEQLADILGVSRQAVSKWESDISYPETEKLLRIGELYECSMDYLLRDGESESVFVPRLRVNAFEKVSKRSVLGLPLWHINIGYGRTAKGVIAIGLSAKGILSIGLFSIGIISFGVFALGILALGVLAIGLLAAGSISCGVIALGAVSIGVVSVGATAVGYFSIGALAVGKYFALGDHAIAQIALGHTKAIGSVYQKLGKLTAQDMADVKELLDGIVPYDLSWAKEWIKLLLNGFSL